MNAVPGGWRRLAVMLVQHAACIMPGAGSPWGDAMRRELDYIEDDQAAMRWALGCIVASYRAKLAYWPLLSAPSAWRQIATCGVLMLLIGLALQDQAGGETEPPRPAIDEMTCGLSDQPPEISPNGTVSLHRNVDNPDAVRLRDCADPHPLKKPDTPRDR